MLPKSSAPWLVSTRTYAAGPPLATTSGTNHTSAPGANATATAAAAARGLGLGASRCGAAGRRDTGSPQPPAPSPCTNSRGTVSHSTRERKPVARPAPNAAGADAGTVAAGDGRACTARPAPAPG